VADRYGPLRRHTRRESRPGGQPATSEQEQAADAYAEDLAAERAGEYASDQEQDDAADAYFDRLQREYP
jgi:hypothetical protein